MAISKSVNQKNSRVNKYTLLTRLGYSISKPSRQFLFFFFFFIQLTPHSTGGHGRGTQQPWVPGSFYVHRNYRGHHDPHSRPPNPPTNVLHYPLSSTSWNQTSASTHRSPVSISTHEAHRHPSALPPQWKATWSPSSTCASHLLQPASLWPTSSL